MNQSLIVAGIIGLVVFVILYLVFSKFGKGKSGPRTQNALRQLMEETQTFEDNVLTNQSIVKEDHAQSPMLKAVAMLPYGDQMAAKILKAGLAHRVPVLGVILLGVFIVVGVGLSNIGLGLLGYVFSLFIALLVVNKILQHRIVKRNDEFIKMFPDVLDMIVRSVRSGFPLNTALKMVADNMEAPVSTEFRQVTDEVALGMSMEQALARLAQRVDEPDIQFFVVVLNVQAETGGNLAEIISNLSGIIRKRKQLRQKIRAMTSEGRASAWVLGALPVLVFLSISYTSPDHMQPLYNTLIGNMLFATAVSLILLTFWVVNQMVDIDI